VTGAIVSGVDAGRDHGVAVDSWGNVNISYRYDS
jgi:hypothetical protein